MSIVRIIFAVLVSMALTFAPGVSARAPMQESTTATMTALADKGEVMPTAMVDTTVHGMAMAEDMPDCMKAEHGDKTGTSKAGCACCDTKTKCPDAANCMAKCSKVLGVLRPAGTTANVTRIAYLLVAFAKPPDWLSAPPAPPPRS